MLQRRRELACGGGGVKSVSICVCTEQNPYNIRKMFLINWPTTLILGGGGKTHSGPNFSMGGGGGHHAPPPRLALVY